MIDKIVKLKILAFCLTCVAFASLISAQNNIAEEVAWVIGDQPIWKSEIEEMYQQMQYERTPINGDPYCVIPERLAVEKLYLHQAELDTVEVQEGMVAQEVDARINYYITNLGSKEKVEQYFNKTIPQLKEDMTESIRNMQKIRMVQNSLTKDLKTTPSDVRKYFSNLDQDSVPYVPLQVEVQIMTINPVIPREEIDEVKARLREYSERINSGEADFSTLAILYSEDGSSMYGGEIGFRGRSALVPEYAAVAFNLNDTKKVSKIVETEYGYHIIQLIEKRGDRINTRHILLRPKVSDKDLEIAINRLDTIRTDILEGKVTFEELVPYVSQDKDTRYSKGMMVNQNTNSTRFEMSQLPQEVAKVVNTMKVGEISMPFIMKSSKSNRDIVAIVKLTNRIDAHKANLSDDFQMIKGMYENARKEEIIKEWLDKKIKDTYIRIEDGWNNCEFEHQGWIKAKKTE
ncbi:MAG: peptidylprolyl isomerase [Muribaculaceae bacterium]|nr:peptidylprolyl isomerase [Muribaculaceae bacterium]